CRLAAAVVVPEAIPLERLRRYLGARPALHAGLVGGRPAPHAGFEGGRPAPHAGFEGARPAPHAGPVKGPGASGKLRRYEGLKEEYYLADFEPDPAVLGELDLDPRRPIVVVRTPPEVSLYHRFHSDLFGAVLERLSAAAVTDGVQPVVFPRVAAQREELASLPGLLVPGRAVDAQSRISCAALTISAGGTMNREAVALGTPVLSTFQG